LGRIPPGRRRNIFLAWLSARTGEWVLESRFPNCPTHRLSVENFECSSQYGRKPRPAPGKLFPPCIRHEGIKTQTACLLSAPPIFVFVYNLETSLRRQLSKIVQLRFDVLVGCANPDVNCGSQWAPPESGPRVLHYVHRTYYKGIAPPEVNGVMSIGHNAIIATWAGRRCGSPCVTCAGTGG